MTDVSSMEPLLPIDSQAQLADLVVELTACTSHLTGKIPVRVQEGVGNLVRSMNCYYSNLIEGHNTKPRDIERAMEEDYSSNDQRRALQKEARAHIEVQQMIDSGQDLDADPTSNEYICWLHREFCRRLPDDLLWVENPDTGESIDVIPGQFRDCDVIVGRHVPIPADELEKFMERFHRVYAQERVPKSQYPIAIAAAHHRLLWIHPFVDGNGRVARLVSHAMLLRSGIGSSLWSISRGLARSSEQYKAVLAGADAARKGDLDGRGALSASALFEFVQYFLQTCIDQVRFMDSILQPEELLRRITLYANDDIDANRLSRGALALLKEAYLTGEFARGDAAKLTGYQERRGRQILAELIQKGLLVSQGPRAPVRLGFPIDVVERWLPGLYPVD